MKVEPKDIEPYRCYRIKGTTYELDFVSLGIASASYCIKVMVIKDTDAEESERYLYGELVTWGISEANMFKIEDDNEAIRYAKFLMI